MSNNESTQHTILKQMEKQNKLIENPKLALEYSARKIQKNEIETSLSLNSHTMKELIQLQNGPYSSTCYGVNPLEFR